MEVAFDYRQTFGCDVVIDMICWRKHGHNEADEPAFTQPVLYKTIKEMRPKIGDTLAMELVASGEFSEDEIKRSKGLSDRLEKAFRLRKSRRRQTGHPDESTATKQPPYNFKGFRHPCAQRNPPSHRRRSTPACPMVLRSTARLSGRWRPS